LLKKIVFAVGLCCLLAGCSSPVKKAAAGSPGTLPSKTATVAPASTSAAQNTNAAGRPLNSHGHLDKRLGENAGIGDPKDPNNPNAQWSLTFTVDSITVDPKCDSGFTQPAQNGHYIAIGIRAATGTNYTNDMYVTFNAADFQVIGPDGVTRSDVQGSAYSCLKDSETFTSNPLGPGQKYSGVVVIDSPVTSGSLIYAPGGTDGWEWKF
jgi:hypothetical protein